MTTWLPPGSLGGFSPVIDTYESTSRVKASLPADADGKIVGGGLLPPDGKGNPAGSAQQPPASPSSAPGERSTWVVPLQSIPPGTDDPRTELSSYCDLNAPPSDVNAVD